MKYHSHRRIGQLRFNHNILMPDILFPNNTAYGGLHEGTSFEVYNGKVWVPTRLMSDGWNMFLQGVCNYIPYGSYVRI